MSISAADQLLAATRTQAGTFEGVPYVRYDGIFQGETSTGAFRVPSGSRLRLRRIPRSGTAR
jgi:hypothetical protein